MLKINKTKEVIVIALILSICITSKATEPFHRHFIVVVDQTIKRSNSNMDIVYESLYSWLNGEKLTNGLNLESSTIPESKGFDPKCDAISLFAFGLSGDGKKMNSDYKRIHTESYNNSRSEEFIFNDIVNSLIHKRSRYFKGQCFSKYNKSQAISFNEFLSTDMRKLFDSTDSLHKKISNESGITMSHFVYPLIMNFISKEETANEYYLIIVSDFKSGQYSNNDADDWETLGNITAKKPTIRKYIEKQINSMRAPFIQADFLHFQAGDIGAKGTRLIMKSLIQKSQVFLSSSLSLSQSSGSVFKVNSAKIAFDKDSRTTIDSIQIVLSENGNILCRKTIERGNDAIAHLLTNSREYEIPSQKVDLGSETFGDITIAYQLYTMSYDASGKPVLPVALSATQCIDKDNISLINKELRKFMTLLTIAIFTSILLLLALWRGKKKEAELSVSAFLDEYVDVTPERGAVRQSCLFHTHGRKPSPIPVKGSIRTAHRFFSIPWRTQAFAIIDNSEKKVKGVTYGVNGRIISEDNKECDLVIPIILNNGHFKFNIDIYIDPKLDISKVRDMKIDILIAAKSGLFNFPSKDPKYYKLPLTILPSESVPAIAAKNRLKSYEFRFFLIEDIGNTWVGIDPGTTGSCMAICGDSQGRADSPRIRLVEVKYGQSMTNIIPSKLVLSKESILGKSISQIIPGEDYDYGVNAEQTWTMHINKGHNCYQSIKKLLGYKKAEDDKIIAKFDGGSERSFTGVELAHLLVKGLKKSLDDYLESLTPKERQVILPDGKEARRAVVAIPNNYTLSKTLDMVNSIKMLGTFQEVRFIYEAEGVLFNYLRMTYGKKKKGTENIMVFDMGGATINVSIFKVDYYVEDHTTRFKVRTLSRIGYAVGGDNIDVALLETIFTMDELKGMPMNDDIQKRHKFEAKNKTKFLYEIFGLKKEIVALQKDAPAERLSNFGSFENFVRKFEESLPERTFETLQENFTKRIKDKLTKSSKAMKEFIYDNIADAVKEVLGSPEVTSIDRVIYSGRSTMFPGVKDIVRNTLSSMYKNVDEKIWDKLSDDEIKTCVANGACWYGRYGLVQLDNSLINGSYGFKHTNEDGPKLHVVLDSQLRFYGDKPITQSEDIESAFAGDANNICFYQIMGNGDTQDIFNEKNRHKLNFLGAIHAKNKTNKISISVDRQNKVNGVVLYESGHVESLNVEAEDHDLVNENEWPYVFHTLTDDQNIQYQSTVDTISTDSRGVRRRR